MRLEVQLKNLKTNILKRVFEMTDEERQAYLDSLHFVFLINNYTKEEAKKFIEDEIDAFKTLADKEKLQFEFRFNYLCYYDVLVELLNNYYS